MELRCCLLFLCCGYHLGVQGFSLQRQRLSVVLRSARTDDENADLVPIRRQKGRQSKPYYEEEEEEYFSDRRGENNEYNYYDEENSDEDNEFDDVIEYLEEALDNWDPAEHPMFGNEVVPNALLDSMDPDGAADRFPELGVYFA